MRQYWHHLQDSLCTQKHQENKGLVKHPQRGITSMNVGDAKSVEKGAMNGRKEISFQSGGNLTFQNDGANDCTKHHFGCSLILEDKRRELFQSFYSLKVYERQSSFVATYKLHTDYPSLMQTKLMMIYQLNRLFCFYFSYDTVTCSHCSQINLTVIMSSMWSRPINTQYLHLMNSNCDICEHA